MPQTHRRSFAETIAALAMRNARVLEARARAAFSLAATYPKQAEAFRKVESAALRQLFRIIADRPETECDTTLGIRSIRLPAWCIRCAALHISEKGKKNEKRQ